MENIDFAEYLSKKISIDFSILRQLIEKSFNLFDVAQILIDKYKVDKETLGKAWGDYIGYAYVDPK